MGNGVVQRQVRKTQLIKGKKVQSIPDFNYTTGNPWMDLYASVMRQAIKDYYSDSKDLTFYDKKTALDFITTSPYYDGIKIFLHRGCV